MKKIREVLRCFAYVTSCVILATAIYIGIFYRESMDKYVILWQILLVSFLCSLGILLYPDRAMSKREAILRTLLHYVEVNAVVLGCGVWFGWFDIRNPWMLMGMLILIAIFCVGVSWLQWKRENRLAALLNARLEEYQKQWEEDRLSVSQTAEDENGGSL